MSALDELFAKAGIQRAQPSKQEQRKVAKAFDREAKMVAFAAAYVKSGYNQVEAYRKFQKRSENRQRMDPSLSSSPNRAKRTRQYWTNLWLGCPLFHKALREIWQRASEEAIAQAAFDLHDMSRLVQAMMMVTHADIMETVTEIDGGSGNATRVTRYKLMDELLLEHRYAISSVTLNESGRIVNVKLHDRVQLAKLYAEIRALLDAKGGDDNEWNVNFQKRMAEARQLRIDAEIRRGKVVMLPSKAGT
jgi:hypothetical protein